MKRIKILFMLQFLIAGIAVSQTITFTNPHEGDVLSDRDVNITAEITATQPDTVWEVIKYQIDNQKWKDYKQNIAGATIYFSVTESFSDDAKHTFRLMAKPSTADTTLDSLQFTVSTPAEVATKSISPSLISPKSEMLNMSASYSKKMDTNTHPKFEFYLNNEKKYTLENSGTWTDDRTYSVQTTQVTNNIPDTDGSLKIKVTNSKNSFGTETPETEIGTVNIDTKSPKATNVDYEPKRKIHIESAGELSLTVSFDSEMDTTKGAVTLYMDNGAAVQFDRDGSWIDNKTFQVKNGGEVGTAFTDGDKAKVRVEAFKDANYNMVEKREDFLAFTFDHTKPTANATTSDPVVHIKEARQVTFTLTFNEEMNTNSNRNPKITLINSSVDTLLMDCVTPQWGADKKTLTVVNGSRIDQSFAAHDVKLNLIIENVYDTAGNKIDKRTISGIIKMDHQAPVLQTVKTFRSYVNRKTFADVKLELSFDEPVMDDVDVYFKNIKIQSTTENKGNQKLSVYIQYALPDSIPNGDTLLVRFSGFKDKYNNQKTNKTSTYGVAVLDTIRPGNPGITAHAHATNKNSFLFSGNKNDDHGLVGIFFNEHLKIPVTDSQSNWQYEHDISGLSDGDSELGKSYTFYLYAQDEAGNNSDTVSTTLIIDRTGPRQVEIKNSLFNNPYINKTTVQYDLTNTSSENAKFYMKESNIDFAQPINSETFFTPGQEVKNLIKTFNNVDGTRTLQFFAYDTLGNKSGILKQYQFIVDRIAPRIKKILVNDKNTNAGDWFVWGPVQGTNIELTFLVEEAVAGIAENAIPNIKLLSETDTISVNGAGSWQDNTYTMEFDLNIPNNGTKDGIYDIQVEGIVDKAANEEKTKKRFYLQIDTQKPERPALTSFSGNEIIDRNNVLSFSGTKPESDATRVIIKEALSEGLYDSTTFSYESDWEVNLLFSDSREYNFRIMSQDLAGNLSDSILFKVTIDWEPPVLTAITPYMDIQLQNRNETGLLTLFFSEKLADVKYPADSLAVYPKGMSYNQAVFPDNIFIQSEKFTATFNSEAIMRIGEWLENGYLPVFKLAEGVVTDVAHNENLPLQDVPFQIIAPSIIQSISDSLLFFSPNNDGITDQISFDVLFNSSEEKYINVNIYNPDHAGSVFSLYRHKLTTGLYVDSASGFQLEYNNTTLRANLVWDGTDSKTKQKIAEGEYFIRVSATNNPEYSVQVPKITKVIADTTPPLIQKTLPAFGSDVLSLSDGMRIKLFPFDPIFLKDKEGDAWQNLYGSIIITKGDTQIISKKMTPQCKTTDTTMAVGNYFYYKINSVLVNKCLGDSVKLQLVVRDNAQQSDTIVVNVRFKKEQERALDYFVNYPNPFNPEAEGTTFQFTKGDAKKFTLRVFDVSGELVALERIDNTMLSASYVNIPWDGKGITGQPLQTGVYYAMITSESKKSKIVKILVYRK